MTKLTALLVVGLVGCGGGGNKQNNKVPCTFTVSGGPGGQYNCIIGLQYSSASNIAELNIDADSFAPFDGITISAGHTGMPQAQTTWVQSDAGATGVVELYAGASFWAGGDTSPQQGDYSFAFSSMDIDVSNGTNTVYNPHGMWSATCPFVPGSAATNTLHVTGSF